MSNRSDAGSGNMEVGPEAATSPASAAPACRCHRWWHALLAGGISLLVGLRLLPLATRTAGGRRIHPAGKSGLDAVTLRRLETELALLRERTPGLLYSVVGRAPAQAEWRPGKGAAAVLGEAAGVFALRDQWEALVHPDDAAALHGLLARAVETGEARLDYRLGTRDGGWRWLHESMLCASRGPAGFEVLGHLSDVSETRLLQEKLMHGSKLALLGEMAAGMAHELNQPLAIIGMAAENLQDSLDSGELSEEECSMRLRRIIEQVERASAIMQHMRTFGRPSGRDLRPVDPRAAAEAALALLKPQLRVENVGAELDLPAGLPPVRATQLQLEQVLMNLLLNARDAFRLSQGRASDRPRTVRISGRATAGGLVEIEVADNAGGIEPDAMAHIFEPFFTTKPSGAGTGLGLSVSQGIVKGFGGRLRASNAGEGACFTIALPAWAGEKPPERPAQQPG